MSEAGGRVRDTAGVEFPKDGEIVWGKVFSFFILYDNSFSTSFFNELLITKSYFVKRI